MKVIKLTEVQEHSFITDFDLSVGHAKYSFKGKQKDVIDNLSELYAEVDSMTYSEIESSFLKTYFNFCGQASYTNFKHPIIHYSTSISIETLANFLRLKNLRVGLITPTFDNLADVVKRHVDSKDIVPIEESSLLKPDTDIDWNALDVLFITLPNNPTGFTLNQSQFTNLVNEVKRRNKVIAIDFCFRLTESEYKEYDQYEIMRKVGVEFIAYEDTGKIWSLSEMKVGVMMASDNQYELLNDISRDILLSVSPFVLRLLDKIISNEDPDTIYINQLVQKNREYLRSKLQNVNFTLVNIDSKSTVEWVEHNRDMNATQLVEKLEEHGVFLSPGAQFYWDDYSRGEKFLRIVLARDTERFKISVDMLVEALSKIDSKIA